MKHLPRSERLNVVFSRCQKTPIFSSFCKITRKWPNDFIFSKNEITSRGDIFVDALNKYVRVANGLFCIFVDNQACRKNMRDSN